MDSDYQKVAQKYCGEIMELKKEIYRLNKIVKRLTPRQKPDAYVWDEDAFRSGSPPKIRIGFSVPEKFKDKAVKLYSFDPSMLQKMGGVQ